MIRSHSGRGAGFAQWLLLAVAVAWGLTFFSTKLLLANLPVTDFLSVRFGIAFVVLVLVAPKALRMPRQVLLHGLIIGLVFSTAQVTQTFGLVYVSASISGFITGLYVVVTPLLGAVLFRLRPKPVVWVAVFLATVGLALLSVRWEDGLRFGVGEWLTLLSAVLWGVHITLVGHWSRPDDVMSLTLAQTGVAAVLFTAFGLLDGLTLPSGGVEWAWMIYFAVVVGAGTEVAQVWAQARVEASKAAVLMVTEPLWAALFAVLFGGESLTWRLLAGGGLMVVAMVMSARSGDQGVGLPDQHAGADGDIAVNQRQTDGAELEMLDGRAEAPDHSPPPI